MLEGAGRSKKGKKNIGRSARKPASIRYKNEKRWNANKIIKAQKHANKTGQNVSIKIEGEIKVIKPAKGE